MRTYAAGNVIVGYEAYIDHGRRRPLETIFSGTYLLTDTFTSKGYSSYRIVFLYVWCASHSPSPHCADSSHTWLEHKTVDGKGNPSDAAPGHNSHKAQKPGNGKSHTKKKKGAIAGGYATAARGAAAQGGGVLSLHSSASAEALEGASTLQTGRKRPRDGGSSDTGADSDLLLPVTTASEDDAVGERPATRARMS